MSQDSEILLFPVGCSRTSSGTNTKTNNRCNLGTDKHDSQGSTPNISQRQHPSIKTKDQEDYNLSFCGCGFLGIYHVGVASCFHEYAPQLSKHKISGSSAGALVAVAHICGNLQLACCITDILRVAIDARARNLGPLHPSFDINALVREALEKGLPDDVHIITSGKLHISLTRVADGENVVISRFDSKEEVIQALLCSCFIPFWSGLSLPKYKGIAYMDGGFSNNLLVLDSKTVTVSPFAGEADICPQDDTHNLLQISLSNTSFSLSPNNLYRLSHALMPPPPEALSDLCEQGFADAIRYLQRMKLISCTKCLEIRSSLLASTDKDASCDVDSERTLPGDQRNSRLMVVDQTDDTVKYSDIREYSGASRRRPMVLVESSGRQPVLAADVTGSSRARCNEFNATGVGVAGRIGKQDNNEPSSDENDEQVGKRRDKDELNEGMSSSKNSATKTHEASMVWSDNNINNDVIEQKNHATIISVKTAKKSSSSLKKLTRFRKLSGLRIFSKSSSDIKRMRESGEDEDSDEDQFEKDANRYNERSSQKIDDSQSVDELFNEETNMKKKRLAFDQKNSNGCGDRPLLENHYKEPPSGHSTDHRLADRTRIIPRQSLGERASKWHYGANSHNMGPRKFTQDKNNNNESTTTTSVMMMFSLSEDEDHGDQDLNSGSDYEDSCDECFQKIQKALRRPTLPEHFSDRIREACENVNKSLSNWLYSHRPIKYLSYLATPYLLPIDISLALVYRCWKRLPEISAELLSCIYQVVNMLIGIVRRGQGRSLTELLMCQPMLMTVVSDTERDPKRNPIASGSVIGNDQRRVSCSSSGCTDYCEQATDWESEAIEFERKLYHKECQRKQRSSQESPEPINCYRQKQQQPSKRVGRGAESELR